MVGVSLFKRAVVDVAGTLGEVLLRCGNIVYDAENENDMEMFNLMMSQQY